MSKSLTEQFQDIKKQYPDALLLFRCGDFYETYFEDADRASAVLNITLTKRSDGMQLCGFPYHALDSYLPKLVRAGFRVAICDQLSDGKEDKNLIKRPVSELVSGELEPNAKEPTPNAPLLPNDRKVTIYTDYGYLRLFRDGVAKELLTRNYKKCYPQDAAEFANQLVQCLYGVDLTK